MNVKLFSLLTQISELNKQINIDVQNFGCRNTLGAFGYAISETDVHFSSNHGKCICKPSFAMFLVVFCKQVLFKVILNTLPWSVTIYSYWRNTVTGDAEAFWSSLNILTHLFALPIRRVVKHHCVFRESISYSLLQKTVYRAFCGTEKCFVNYGNVLCSWVTYYFLKKYLAQWNYLCDIMYILKNDGHPLEESHL